MPFDYQFLRERGLPADVAARVAGGSTTTAPATSTASAGTLTGAPPFNYAGAYGGVPQVPSPVSTAGQAVSGNVANLPGISTLATQATTLGNTLAKSGYEQNLPGYAGNLSQAAVNAGNLLQGQIPPDVLRQIQQAAAERGVAIGSPGSPNANAAMLRALGLTSLNLQGEGLQQFGKLMGLTPVGQPFNPASMMVSPDALQAAQMAANLYASAPVPALAAQANLNAMLTGLNRGQMTTAPGVSMPTMPSSSPTGVRTPLYNPMLTQPTAPGASTGGWGSLTQVSDEDQMLNDIMTKYDTGYFYPEASEGPGFEPYARISNTEYNYPTMAEFPGYEEEF